MSSFSLATHTAPRRGDSPAQEDAMAPSHLLVAPLICWALCSHLPSLAKLCTLLGMRAHLLVSYPNPIHLSGPSSNVLDFISCSYKATIWGGGAGGPKGE